MTLYGWKKWVIFCKIKFRSPETSKSQLNKIIISRTFYLYTDDTEKNGTFQNFFQIAQSLTTTCYIYNINNYLHSQFNILKFNLSSFCIQAKLIKLIYVKYILSFFPTQNYDIPQRQIYQNRSHLIIHSMEIVQKIMFQTSCFFARNIICFMLDILYQPYLLNKILFTFIRNEKIFLKDNKK
ncbi:hypothetical protein TTHERM_000353539 (macronuclear) [Tetrahymena thermophila SB210]|uniref:Uncharacterized protein n=1 Tax=Tetrahymena thermophila (strain SB210) TaxID=312017 RepID=W7X034_TETTS|nr:hypothetical protein TTHERM_000353539 [Tetrahymena thermophila SB210]EWS72470.1 hypothetical protein TTHERM_000353539 [Tetrahymena thermophila SB210]|eukprot:XP_012654967.1 hypothetical protein TTHERM_000353539 [Tetrahymena thermophila SB210]